MKKQMILLSLCVMAAALPLPANIFYFATTGNDSNPCTVGQPCKSFRAAAVSSVASGDTILALDGVDFNLQQLAAGAFPQSVTIDGGQHGAFMTGANGAAGLYLNAGSGAPIWVLRNLIITVGANGSIPPQGIFLNLPGGSLTMDNVTIISQNVQGAAISGTVSNGGAVHMNGVTIVGAGSGIYLNNGTPSGGPFPFTAENLVVDVTGPGVQIIDGYGTIRNSKFRSGASGTTGVALTTSSTTPSWLFDTCSFENLGYGLVIGGGETVRISNSEFSGNGTGIFNSGTAISFRNNVFAGNSTDGAPSLTTSLK
ncbi:MAG: right-handed parallel beta-helix repeat-containing protein [Bryobacteraceae bacterium]|jgi:hypothetical protein